MRGLMFLVVAIALGAGIGIGGYILYDTYFPSPARSLEKAKAKFEQAELVFAGDKLAAEPYYMEVSKQLDKMAERATRADTANNTQGFMVRAKVLWRLGDIARARDAGPGGIAEQGRYQTAALKIYQDCLQDFDKDNLEAASALLDNYAGRDDLSHAELYAETVAKYQLKEGEEPTKELYTRQALAHFLIAQRYLRGQDPKPELALQHIRAIPSLPRPSGSPNDKRWREYAVEVQALKMRLDMARKQAAEGGAPASNVTREDIERELKAVITEGIALTRLKLASSVPGDDKHPPIPELAHELRPTNIRGLLDFLTIAIEASATKEEALERADLLIAVSRQLVSAKNAPETAIRESSIRDATIAVVADHLAKLPTSVERPAIERKDPRLRPLPADWSPVEARLREVLQLAEAAGAPISPDAWLELARKAHMDRRWKDAEDSARKGLELAHKNNLGPDYVSVQNLHSEVAWALFSQGKASAAEDHLAALRKLPGHARMANIIDGLAAVRDGRLDLGARNLLAAQSDPRYANSLLTLAGLARAFQGLGDPARALLLLTKIDTLYKSIDKLSDEERALAAEYYPSADSVALEAMRCHLALNQLPEAQTYRKRLEGRPLDLAARILLINHYITLGRNELAKGNPLDARDNFDAARAEIKALPEPQRQEPAIVWAEVLATAGQPERKFAQGSAGPSNVEKAEKLLKDYVSSRRDLESYLLWVRWLESRGRPGEADAVLTDMDQHFGDHKKTIEVVRAGLALKRAQNNDIAGLVAALQSPGADASGDVLELLYLVNPSESGTKARTTVGAVLGQHESTVLYHLWNGLRAQKAGAFADAAREYGRALYPSRYRAKAQLGLLTNLLALAAKDSPKSAADVIDNLRVDNPADPAALIAYAEVARLLDNIQGNNSMQAALNDLERGLTVLNRRAVAADLLARGYYAAGRADLARSEAVRAVKLDPAYAPALHMAALTTAAEGDYEASLHYAEDLERALYGTPAAKRDAPVAAAPKSILDRPQPTLADGKFLRAEALKKLGRRGEAQRIFQELIDKHSTLSAGYLGLADLQADARNYKSALSAVREWRAKNPQDAAGASAELRILTRAGQMGEVQKVASVFAGNNAKLLTTVSRAFADAEAYDAAEAWGHEALKNAKDKPNDIIAAQLAIADACRARALTKQSSDRQADVEKALAAYKAVWQLKPGLPAAGYPLAALQAREHDEAGAAYAVVQDVRKGMYSGRMVSGDRLSVEQLDVLGDVYRISKHAGDAVTLFREAVAQRYEHEPRVLLQFGLACRDQNLPGDAAAILLRAEQSALERADTAVADAARTARTKLDGKNK
jgi:hypothetical protein